MNRKAAKFAKERKVFWGEAKRGGGEVAESTQRKRGWGFEEFTAKAQDEERGRSNFKNPEQYQDWLLEVVAASIGMIRRQLRVKTKRRYIYTVPARTLKELEAQFARLRRTVARSEILVEKEDVRAEVQRAEIRKAALAAMRDAEFQRFLGKATNPAPTSRKR